jgi:hypothetical protein
MKEDEVGLNETILFNIAVGFALSPITSLSKKNADIFKLL